MDQGPLRVHLELEGMNLVCEYLSCSSHAQRAPERLRVGLFQGCGFVQ